MTAVTRQGAQRRLAWAVMSSDGCGAGGQAGSRVAVCTSAAVTGRGGLSGRGQAGQGRTRPGVGRAETVGADSASGLYDQPARRAAISMPPPSRSINQASSEPAMDPLMMAEADTTAPAASR